MTAEQIKAIDACAAAWQEWYKHQRDANEESYWLSYCNAHDAMTALGVKESFAEDGAVQYG